MGWGVVCSCRLPYAEQAWGHAPPRSQVLQPVDTAHFHRAHSTLWLCPLPRHALCSLHMPCTPRGCSQRVVPVQGAGACGGVEHSCRLPRREWVQGTYPTSQPCAVGSGFCPCPTAHSLQPHTMSPHMPHSGSGSPCGTLWPHAHASGCSLDGDGAYGHVWGARLVATEYHLGRRQEGVPCTTAVCCSRCVLYKLSWPLPLPLSVCLSVSKAPGCACAVGQEHYGQTDTPEVPWLLLH